MGFSDSFGYFFGIISESEIVLFFQNIISESQIFVQFRNLISESQIFVQFRNTISESQILVQLKNTISEYIISDWRAKRAQRNFLTIWENIISEYLFGIPR